MQKVQRNVPDFNLAVFVYRGREIAYMSDVVYFVVMDLQYISS